MDDDGPTRLSILFFSHFVSKPNPTSGKYRIVKIWYGTVTNLVLLYSSLNSSGIENKRTDYSSLSDN